MKASVRMTAITDPFARPVCRRYTPPARRRHNIARELA
jgi:hypothetical protein